MRSLLAIALVVGLGAAATATPAGAANMTCKMRYSLDGWSIFYKRATGTGSVTCSNGQRLAVRLSAHGGGPSVGRFRIRDGFGEFGGVYRISWPCPARARAGTWASRSPGSPSRRAKCW
jgi:hypothetical protein